MQLAIKHTLYCPEPNGACSAGRLCCTTELAGGGAARVARRFVPLIKLALANSTMEDTVVWRLGRQAVSMRSHLPTNILSSGATPDPPTAARKQWRG